MADWLEEDIRCIRAPNRSPMTKGGTNTYLLGRGEVAVIDPGPAIDSHLEAILAALDPGEVIRQIFVTHSHLDHSPLAAPLAAETGAPVLAYGPSAAGRSALMQELAQTLSIGGGEGVDAQFAPDQQLEDGGTYPAGSTRVQAVWTPGHFGNHMCFVSGDRVFTGDHVMGWASSLVSPPDGDLTDFMRSCERLQKIPARVYYSGHGDPITAPHDRLNWLISHRRQREAQVLDALSQGAATPAELTAALYADVPAALHPAAERNVLAHLIDLSGRGLVSAEAGLRANSRFELTSRTVR